MMPLNIGHRMFIAQCICTVNLKITFNINSQVRNIHKQFLKTSLFVAVKVVSQVRRAATIDKVGISILCQRIQKCFVLF